MSTKLQLLQFWKTKKIVRDQRLLDAFFSIPRESFLPDKFKGEAYHDHPLPTLRKQSISQPTTIMLMLQALNLNEGHKVFEIGAGVGYQAALIAKVIGSEGKLISAEVIPELVTEARDNLNGLGLSNAKIIEADGGDGYIEGAPFDRVVITAACPMIPQPLIDQLKEGGVVIAPVGYFDDQTMVKGTKRGKGLDLEFLGRFKFVPLVGKYGLKEI